jgi:hypothetical protein
MPQKREASVQLARINGKLKTRPTVRNHLARLVAFAKHEAVQKSPLEVEPCLPRRRRRRVAPTPAHGQRRVITM